MKKYKITMKDGTAFVVESKWIELYTIITDLINPQPFYEIGCVIIAKDAIAFIEKIEEEKLTEEMENRYEQDIFDWSADQGCGAAENAIWQSGGILHLGGE
jgi:hypothetical protein